MNNSIREQDIANVLGDKLGLKLTANNMRELNDIIDELIPVIDADWKGDYLTAGDFFDSYSNVSPSLGVMVRASKSEVRQLMSMLDARGINSLAFANETRDEYYYTVDEVPTDMVYVTLLMDVAEALEHLKNLSKVIGRDIEASIEDLYPMTDANDARYRCDDSSVVWTISDGVVTGGGKYVLPVNDDELFIIRVHWLDQLEKDIQELNAMGIEVVFDEG